MTQAYSMINVQATLDGRTVIGFMDGDDVVQVAPGADVGSMMIGADGSSLFSQTADRSALITLRLKHTSPTHRQLTEKWRAQRAGRLIGFRFDVIEKETKEGGVGSECYIQTAPTDQKGTNASVREWVLVTGDWTPNIPEVTTQN